MEIFNKEEFKRLTQDKFFFDLLQKHIDKAKNSSMARKMLHGLINLLPDEININVEEYLIDLMGYSERCNLIPMKCATVFEKIEDFNKLYFISTCLCDEDFFNLFNIYLAILTFYAYENDEYKKYLGARYGSFFITKIIYNLKLKAKYITRLGLYSRARKNGLENDEALNYGNTIYPATVADDVYFEKIRIKGLNIL